MNEALRIGSLIDARQLETLCSWPAGCISTIAWLTIQEQANGAELKSIATMLGIEESDLVSLIESTVNLTGDEAKDKWMEGIITLKTARRMNEQTIATGWDSIESLALAKAHAGLAATRSNGDPEEMLRIAAAANRALRRQRGEGSKGAGADISINADGSIDAKLKGGELGFIRLRLSPAVASQIQNPTRIIDGNINKPNSTKDKEMLSLNETRAAADDGGDNDIIQRRGKHAEAKRHTDELDEMRGRIRDAFNTTGPGARE